MRLLIDALIFQREKSPGYQTYLFNLLDYFFLHRDDLKFAEIVVIVRLDQEDFFNSYTQKFKIYPIKISGYISLFTQQNRFKRIFGLSNNDVILYTYNYSSLLPQAQSILVIHDLQFRRFPEYWSRLKYWQRMIFLPVSIFLARRVVAISNFTKSEIEHYYPFSVGKIDVIYNYCNFKKFQIDQLNNIPGCYFGGRFFLSVSSLDSHKNIECLVEAFAFFIQNGFDYNLILVGSRENASPLIHALITEHQLHDRVIFTGYISDLVLMYLYKNCTAFILPTRYEGFGIPIVESLYFGSPTILSDISICREIGDDFALYFHPDRPDQLLELMCNLVLGTKSIPQGSTKYTIKRFSPNKTSRRYIELLNGMVEF